MTREEVTRILRKAGHWSVYTDTRKIEGPNPSAWAGGVLDKSPVGNRVQNYEQLFSVLHELGHIAYPPEGLADYRKRPFSPEVMRSEIAAWIYAKGCVKQEAQAAIDEVAIACLLTYAMCAECPSYWHEARLRMLINGDVVVRKTPYGNLYDFFPKILRR